MAEGKTIVIRGLTELEEFDQCVELQNLVWSYDSTGMMSQKVFLLASRIGGQVLGAYAGDELVGYSMSLPGVRNGHAYLHSHHLAVHPDWRNEGVGRRLKLAQRDEAMGRGFELIEWTFDPLEIKNAHLNFARLGAITRRYRENFYGASNSPLHGGLPTDRIYAEWWLKSDRVQKALAGERPVMDVVETVEVPAEIYAWKASDEDRPKAFEVQRRNAVALEAAFDKGLAVLGYERSANGDGRFLLGKWNEGFAY
ncbi:MAG: GNAT family N-acetyltransferase [Acidobacteriota bacterium]